MILRQDWQLCGGGARFWLVIAVETLLSVVDADAVPYLTARGAPPTLLEGQSRDVRAASLIRALRRLAHVDITLADELWSRLFDATWCRLSRADQTQVAAHLLKLLSARSNRRDLFVPLLQSGPNGDALGVSRGSRTSPVLPQRVNVVQTLLRSMVSVAGPHAPGLSPELVVHLAVSYDAWNSALRICEFQVENAALSVDTRLRWIEALSVIYKLLNEDDWRVGLSLENIAQPETRAALVLEALGCVHEAQEEYFKALSKAQSGRVSMDDVNLFELRLWEERWVGCAKQLCQWQLMHDFAKSTQNQELLLDCAWKRGDWAGAKQLLSATAAASSSMAEGVVGDPQTHLQRLYIAILDNEKRVAVDNLTNQTTQLALFHWQGLPRVLGRSHVALLHLFHQLVEVKESIQMMSDIKHASQQLHTLPNLKPSINTWRERLPNKWEPILLWDDILTWRSHMFQVVKTTFSWSDAQVLACMHDSPWSVIRLAHTARKQHLPDVCLGALAKLYAIPAMDVQDAFSKLREQVSICYESSSDYRGGLSILNNTNLDYFSLRQKAEMFRLKALFLEAMGEQAEANQTFSYCLQICDSYGKGWLSWGHYCYRLFLERKELPFASQTIACYLQAIHHRCNAARLMIARVLWLLSMDDPNGNGTLVQSFETHGKQLPIWIWIIWIPQLLMALRRPEAPQIRGLLRGLSAKFPQALYYTMRAFFLENRDSAMTSGAGSDPSRPPTPSSANMVYYRAKSGHIVSVPAAMPLAQVQQIPGLIAPSRPTPGAFGAAPSAVLSLDAWRERLMLGTNGSASREAQGGGDVASASKADVGPVQYTEDLLNFLRRTHDALTFEMECVLEEMITKFRPEPEEELLTAVHSLLLKCYQLPRLSHSEMVPRMLRAALEKVWRKLFVIAPATPAMGASTPAAAAVQKNEKHAAFVDKFKDAFEADFAPPAMLGNAEETVTLFEMMDRLKKWRDLLQRRVQRFGERGAGTLRLEHCSRFLMEFGPSNIEIPGQYISDNEPIKDLHARIVHFDHDVDVLLRGGLLLRHKETKKRNAVFHVPKIIPLTPRLSLAKAKAFDEICRNHVPETLLSKYVFLISAHADAYFQFRNEFAKHLALSSFLSYALFVGDRAPHRVLFSQQTARVVSAELRPGYASSGILEASSSMPFRLTRNLHNFITRPGVQGPFSVVMAATAEALMSEEDLMGNQLCLFFRDDLLSWHASKLRLAGPTTPLESPAMGASGQTHAQRQRRLESQVQQRVDANVSLVMERIRGISLKKESESQRGKSVRELLDVATSPERQREMYPTWCPWL
ncbi:hypothetical protein ATCC90586_000160 [Pythium insidiosum]|nr:hypothetical protein ATCC90586_000160 [Pythium insidiosum]